MSRVVGDLPAKGQNFVGMRTALVAIDCLMLMLSLVMYAQEDVWGYAFYGVLCTIIVHVPIILRMVPALSIWGVLAFVVTRSEEHTSELQSRFDLVCR